VLTGVAVTAAIAKAQHWGLLIPPFGLWGGLTVAIVISGIAVLYPAARAARLSPTEALRTI
jgi:putative ABC transport system permease protein